MLKSENKGVYFAFISYLLLIFFFFAPVLVGNENLLVYPLDTDIIFSRFVERANWIRQGIIPYWDNKSISGQSLLERAPPVHLLNLQPWLMVILGNKLGYGLFIYFMVVLSAFSVFLLALKRFNMSYFFAFSAGVTVALGYTIGASYASLFIFHPFTALFFYNFIPVIFSNQTFPSLVLKALYSAMVISLSFYCQEPRVAEFTFHTTLIFISISLLTNRSISILIVLKNILIFSIVFLSFCFLFSAPILMDFINSLSHQTRQGAGMGNPGWFNMPPIYSLLSTIGNAIPINLAIHKDDHHVDILGSHFTIYKHFISVLYVPVILFALNNRGKFNHLERTTIYTSIFLKFTCTLYEFIPGVQILLVSVLKTGRFLEHDQSLLFGAISVFMISNKLSSGDLSQCDHKVTQIALRFQFTLLLLTAALASFFLAFGNQLNRVFLDHFQAISQYSQLMDFLKTEFQSRFKYMIFSSFLLVAQIHIFSIWLNGRAWKYSKHAFFIVSISTPFLLSKANHPFNTKETKFDHKCADNVILKSLTPWDRCDNVDFPHSYMYSEKNDSRHQLTHMNPKSLEYQINLYPFSTVSNFYHFIDDRIYRYLEKMYENDPGYKTAYQNRFYFYPQDNNLFHLLGVSAFVSEINCFSIPFELRQHTENYYHYKNTKVLPRYYLANQLIYLDGDNLILNQLMDMEYESLKHTVILPEDEKKNPQHHFQPEPEGLIALSYMPCEVKFSTNFKSPQFLVLTDTYHKDWHARIDSNETEILRSNFLFRGVHIPPGHHTVIFRYEMGRFKFHLFLFTCGIVLAIGAMMFCKIEKPKASERSIL